MLTVRARRSLEAVVCAPNQTSDLRQKIGAPPTFAASGDLASD
jgi:hypothetical protein